MRLYSCGELAAMFSDEMSEDISERRVRDWAREYKWPRVEIGRAIRFTEEHVTEIIARHTVASGSQQAKPVLISGQTQRSARRSS